MDEVLNLGKVNSAQEGGQGDQAPSLLVSNFRKTKARDLLKALVISMTILLCFVLYTALCRRRGPSYVVVVSS